MQQDMKSKRRLQREANPQMPQWVPPIIDSQYQDQSLFDLEDEQNDKLKEGKTYQMSDLDFTKIDWDPFFKTLQNQILLDFFYKLGKKHIPRHLINKGIIEDASQWDDRSFFLQIKQYIMEELDIVQLWVDWNIRKVQQNQKIKRKIKQKEEFKKKQLQDIQVLLDKIVQKNREKTQDLIIQEFIQKRNTIHFEPLKKDELDQDDKAQIQLQRKQNAERLEKAEQKLKIQQACMEDLFLRLEQQFSSTKFNF